MGKEFRGGHRINLQLFSDKSEAPTPKRRQESRAKGQVFRSMEVTAAVTLLVALQTLRLSGPFMYGEIMSFMSSTLSHFPRGDFSVDDVGALNIVGTTALLKIVLPIMGLIMAAGVIVNLFQVGFLFTSEPLSPNFGRLNPITGWQRLFSQRALVELVKAVLKLLLVGATAYLGLQQEMQQFILLPDMEAKQAVAQIAALIYRISLRMVLTLLFLAGLDYLYQRWDHEQQLKMTKQEIKEEMRQSEGDPQIKARVRQIQRSLAMRRMMAAVPRADVVITNPTHYAVALRYEAKTMAAPVVVAKGADYLAVKIKQVATENQVALVENRTLARGLYETVDVGEVVPEALYQAVAEVLAFVFRLKGRV